jgi:integrase
MIFFAALPGNNSRSYDFLYSTRYERYLIYSLALSTSLRANEIRTLTVSDFDFAHHTVTVRPKNEKARRGATLPLQKELSTKIKEFTKYKTPAARALNVPSKTSEMLQVDLAEAKIEYKTDRGYADFHSLRHTFGTILAKSGAAPQIAQKLMRHSDPRLTQNYYTHLLVEDLRSATDKIAVVLNGFAVDILDFLRNCHHLHFVYL